MAVVSRPIHHDEPDLLVGLEFEKLLITDLDNNVLTEAPAPTSGWTHDLLEKYESDQISLPAWELYLKDFDNWIGGSEV